MGSSEKIKEPASAVIPAIRRLQSRGIGSGQAPVVISGLDGSGARQARQGGLRAAKHPRSDGSAIVREYVHQLLGGLAVSCASLTLCGRSASTSHSCLFLFYLTLSRFAYQTVFSPRSREALPLDHERTKACRDSNRSVD